MLSRSLPRVASLLAGACAAFDAVAQTQASAFDLSIEELGQLQVTTASRRAETLSQTPAAVYVITADEIRLSGVTTIMDALRLAPGVEVARNGSSEWTISIRGFSSDLSNKLLVLIDGRSVYSPLFAGVFWDVQDTLLADIERIEVVSGPGGAIWGANAVNGVINIITQSASDTLGAAAEVGAGNEEQGFASFRYGFRINESLTARAYGKYFARDASQLAATGGSAFDDWHVGRGGFAMEWEPNGVDRVNVRTDFYEGKEDALLRGDFTLGTLPPADAPGTVPISGASVVATWRHGLGNDSNWRVQFYYDRTDREIAGSFAEARDTYNVAFQHDLADIGRHDVQWGAELRSTSDDIGNTTFATFVPASRSDQTLSTFVQDRIAIADERLYVTLGAKLEHNDYTGGEEQPNVRVTWLPGNRQTVWGAVSRAVRVPARLNTDLRLLAPVASPGLPAPLYVNVNGNPDFVSEELVAYEAGYRVQIGDDVSFDLAVFDNYYDHLQSTQSGALTAVPGPPAYLLLPAMQANLMEGETYGGTFVATWQPSAQWRLQLQYAHLQMDLAGKPGNNDSGSLRISGNSAKNRIALQSYVALPHDLSLYTSVRYVDELPEEAVPSYVAVDWSLAWRPTEALQVSLTLQNANDAERLEFGDGREIERSGYARLVWTF